MEKWYQKIRRGDVWFLSLSPQDIGDIPGSSVEKKSRPYLVVSCEESNRNAPIVNAVPITTRNSDDYPMHVYYRFQDKSGERNQVILCEQVTTLSIVVFERHSSNFMYSLRPELMEKVDIALAGQLGLRPQPMNMHQLEELIEKLAQRKLEEIQKQQTATAELDISKVVAELSEKFNIDLNESQPLKEEATDLPVQVPLTEKAGTRQKTNQVEEKKKKNELKSTKLPKKDEKAKRSWDEQSRKAFLEDYDHLSVAEMAEKYNVQKKSVYQLVYQFRKTLNSSSSSEK